MPYIEKVDDNEYFNPTSNTIIINDNQCNNPSDNNVVPPIHSIDEMENNKRWKWLIDSWMGMNFKEKMHLFINRIEYINYESIPSGDAADTYINNRIIDTLYDNCRTLKEIKFTVNRIGIPSIAIIMNPIDINMVPDDDTKVSMKKWVDKYGFI